MWGVTVGHAAILQVTSRAIRGDSLLLKVCAQEIRGARRLHGGSDPDETTLATLIASVILERPTCLTCVSAKVGATNLYTLRTIERIAERTLRVSIERGGRCRACGSTLGPVFSVERAK
jgi:hypothetical protein